MSEPRPAIVPAYPEEELPATIECRCPACGWYVLTRPSAVDMPCPCVANQEKPGSCPGRITAAKHATSLAPPPAPS